MSRSVERYLTRRELAKFLTEHGFVISLSTLNKYAAAGGADEGPPCAGYWGRNTLYDPDAALRWARKRFRTHWRGETAA
jgi:hypothetical protein